QLEGVKMTMRMPGLSLLTLDTVRVCLEHHMNFDRTGYPEVQHEWGQATLSRIVAVGDCFDAITAHRTYHKRPRSAFEALQYLLGPTRVSFDPAVLWALVRTVGLYPAGSVMHTRPRHLALPLRPDPHRGRPAAAVRPHPDGAGRHQPAPRARRHLEPDAAHGKRRARAQARGLRSPARRRARGVNAQTGGDVAPPAVLR